MLLPQDILSQQIVLVNGHSDGNDVTDVLVYYEGCKRIVNDRILIQPNNSAPFSDATKDRLQLRQFLSVGFVTVVFVFQPNVVYRHTLKSPKIKSRFVNCNREMLFFITHENHSVGQICFI
jgi:hypothetical protein